MRGFDVVVDEQNGNTKAGETNQRDDLRFPKPHILSNRFGIWYFFRVVAHDATRTLAPFASRNAAARTLRDMHATHGALT